MSDPLEILRGYGELTEGLSFPAVVRHPLADETERLVKLGIKEKDCHSCDVICAFNDELVFISLFSTFGTTRKSFVNYEFDEEASFGSNHFTVATEQFPLKMIHVEKMLHYLSDWLTNEDNEAIKTKRLKPVRIMDVDCCR